MFPTFERTAAPLSSVSLWDPGAERSAPVDAELESRRAQARAQGLEEGRAAGRAEGRAAALAEWSARLQALAVALEQAARALSARRLELAAEVDRRLPALALLLGEKIVRQELGHSATAAQTTIRALSERLAGCGQAVAVRLAPPVVEAFEAWRGSAPPTSSPPGLRVEADPSLGAGEWLIETDDGFLDGRIASQLESAWRAVSEVLG